MIYGQIASGVGIFALAYLAFYKQGFKFEVSTLVKVSFLVLVSFVLALFSWFIPIMGFPAIKIGFSQIPLMLVGFLFGPSWGFLAGLSADMIELMSGTIVLPFFGFTLNKILIAMIPGIIRKYKEKANLYEIVVFVMALSAAAIAYVFTRESVTINDVLIAVNINTKIIVSLGITILSSALVYAIHAITKHEIFDYTYLWVFSVILVELAVNLTLTPIWLNIMYGLPISVSVTVRLLKIVLMIPFSAFIGLFSIRVLTKVKV